MKRTLFILAAALAMPMAAAHAQTSNNTCFSTDVSTYTTSFSPTACWGSYTGNNDPSMNSFIFGLLGSQYANASDWTAGSNINVGGDLKTGQIAFGAPQSGIFAVALKAGNGGQGNFPNAGWAVYVFNTGAVQVQGFKFDTRAMGNDNGQKPGLSHWTLYNYTSGGGGGGGTPVPEPSTIALTAVGLLGLGAVSRRRRQSR